MYQEPAHAIPWSEEKLSHLQTFLTGEWAEDIWLMACQDGVGKLHQRSLAVSLTSPSLTIELKYALWYQFTQGKSRTPGGRNMLFYKLQTLIAWLNQIPPTIHSLLERNLDTWECSLRTWLIQRGQYAPASGKRLHATQTFAEYRSEDQRLLFFRVLYRTLVAAYDDRAETEKDIWDLRKLGVIFNRSQSGYMLNFLPITQPWLRSLVKHYLKYNLAVYSAGDCQCKLSALRQFSQFLAETAPQIQTVNLDRALILHYLSFLVEQKLSVGTRNRYLVTLRTFLETSAHRLQAPGLTKERIIFDDDLVKLPEYGTREIPEEVLVQLRAHLDTLPTTTLRMVTILLEVGLRINELCQLPLNCLICDDKHEWYLRCYQSKTHREHVIPLVDANVIGTIQAQQQEIRTTRGTTCPYLFPSPISHTNPYLQGTFRNILNKWAVKYEIKDQSQQLYHFTAHQFRHSLGMRLLNDDVPLEVISRLLGHHSLKMTEIYARVRDKKLRTDLERVARKRKTVDYQGNAVKGDPRANDPEAQMTRKGVRGQTLPVGGCGRLVVLGECSYANKCLTCPMWLTSTDDVPALKSFHERAMRLKQRAMEAGNQHVSEQQSRILPILAVRIKSLEDTSMDGSLCVEDVLAQLRTDLAEAACGLEEAREAGALLAVKSVEWMITELKARMTALEEPV